MRTVVALAGLIPLHVGTGHLVRESILGVLVGVGLVGGYLLVLRWLRGGSGRRDRRNRPGSEG